MRANGSDDLAPPDRWSEALFFGLLDGRVALVDRETLVTAEGDR